jgi:sulfotransferase family protein
MTGPVRIAMWSGPRNISTALMRSWGNRPDTLVVDEPFYGLYLQRTGAPHPGAAEVIAQTETDSGKIIAGLLGRLPPGKSVFYQKQMTHHLLPEIDRSWLRQVTNCFLIRDPAEVITSYIRKRDEPAIEDLGFIQQIEIFQLVRQHTDTIPPVIDARDVLEHPKRTLELLCDAVGLKFDDAMLSWPPGLRDTDGIWAGHWYVEVAKSVGFQAYRPRTDEVPTRFRKICDRCGECYQELYEYRLH